MSFKSYVHCCSLKDLYLIFFNLRKHLYSFFKKSTERERKREREGGRFYMYKARQSAQDRKVQVVYF